MQSSEEVRQINSALIHCTRLKTQLQGTLMHVQRLTSKYNQTDYMAVIRNLDNYRKSSCLLSSPYPKLVRQSDHSSTDDFNNSGHNDSQQYSTPVKQQRSNNLLRRIHMNNILTSTPNHSNRSTNRIVDSLDSCESNDKIDDDIIDTPRRTIRDMKTNNNTISVRTIKVQRNIASIITHLQVMQKSHKKRQRQQLEQSLYQSCCNSSMASPGLLGHSACSMESSIGNSFVTAFGSNESLHNRSNYSTPKHFNRYNEDQKILERMQRFYATPLQRMHKRLIHLNASLIRTC